MDTTKIELSEEQKNAWLAGILECRCAYYSEGEPGIVIEHPSKELINAFIERANLKNRKLNEGINQTNRETTYILSVTGLELRNLFMKARKYILSDKWSNLIAIMGI